MREATGNLIGLIRSGGFLRSWVADLIYDGERRAADLRLQDPSFSWDGGAQIAGSGSCTVHASNLFGRGIVPAQIGDLFSPFGAELQVDMLIRAGSFSERIPMGRFVLDSVPEGIERTIPGVAGGLPVVVDSRVKLTLKDYMLRVQRDKFAFPTSPRSTSMWTEAFNLTGLAVLRNLSDEPIPASVTYDEDRLQALDDVFAVADAWPHLTPAGQLTARPKVWPSAIDEFRGIVSAPRSMESDRVYNRVVVEGKSPAGAVIREVAEITQGYLRVRNTDGTRSPFGVATLREQNDMLTTAAQCRARARSLLSQVSQLRAVTRSVTERLNPLREVGDVVELAGTATRILSVRHDVATTTCVVEEAS